MVKWFLFFLIALLAACNPVKTVKTVFVSLSPYEAYVKSLEKARLDKSAMAVAWLAAGRNVFNDSVFTPLPYSEAGFFQASEAEARSYRFSVKEGQVLTVEGTFMSRENAKVFIDLFVFRENAWKHAAFADSTFALTHEFDQNETCVLRVQPELLVNAYYSVSISLTPVLINPVKGASNKSIGSFFGAPRDGGKRSHEGVDIFAKRGTPVIAPTDGVVSRVGINRLGGKVVWMHDLKRRHSYYFAHLDSQAVVPGARVRQGDMLGTVGNTGNARTTPPHLHFGIYQYGSKDPLHYIQTIEAVVQTMPVDTAFQQQAFKTKLKVTALFESPLQKLASRARLSKGSFVRVIGQSGEWYRVLLPDYKQGFVPKKALEPLDKGKPFTVKESTYLLSHVAPQPIPVLQLAPKQRVEVYAAFEDYVFVRTENGVSGWLAVNKSGS